MRFIDRTAARHQAGFLTPRSVATLVVLIGALLLPLWWLKGGAKQREVAAAQEQAQQAPTPTFAPSTPAQVHNPEAFGMTWGVLPTPKLPESVVWMGCHGEPKEGISQPHAGSCNPYRGDASCRLALPVLCILKDGSTPETVLGASAQAMPSASPASGAVTDAGVRTDAWAGGAVASTAPVAGFVLGSLEAAHARCETELGRGWRMASFHDGAGGANGSAGWGFVAQRSGRLDTRLRHWVYIQDQPGNCWNN